MKTTFHLTEAEADALISDFKHKRDVAFDNERSEEAHTWAAAARAIHDAQMASFQRRSEARRKRDTAKQGQHAKATH